MANEQEVKYLVPGLERGLQLLLAFGEQHRDLTFAELQCDQIVNEWLFN